MIPALLKQILKAISDLLNHIDRKFSELQTHVDAKFKETDEKINNISVPSQDLTPIVNAIRDGFAAQAELLKQILDAVLPLPAVGFRFDVILEGQLLEGVTTLQITDTQKFTASIAPVDAKGNAATVEAGSVVWAGPDFLKIVPSADGLQAEISAVGPLGSGQVTVTGDSDLTAGVKLISAPLQVDVVGGAAVGFAINTSAPVEQDAAPVVPPVVEPPPVVVPPVDGGGEPPPGV